MLVYSKLEIDNFIKTYFIEIDQITYSQIYELFGYVWDEDNFKSASYVVRTKFNHLLKK